MNFFNLREVVRSMEIDPSTADAPVKREFLCDGEFLTANVGIVSGSENALHTQTHHDEIVVVLEGEAEFKVGAEIRRVGPGDMIFIPRNTLHGPMIAKNSKFAGLSIYAPFFDRSKTNIKWDRDRPRS